MKSSNPEHRESNNHNEEIHSELFKLTIKQIPNYLLGSTFIIFGFGFLFWDIFTQISLLTWLIFSFTLLAISFYYIIKSQNIKIHTENFTYLNNILLFVAIIHGLLWGTLSILFNDPNSFQNNLLLALTLLLVITQIAAITAMNKRVFFFATTPILIPLILMNIIFNTEKLQFEIAIVCSLYFMICYFFYNNVHNSLINSVKYKIINSQLTQQLTDKVQNANESNSNKSRFLAAASHDLRQPIHAQTLLIEELIERVDDPNLINLIRDIKISTNALHELFDAIMDISKLDNDKIVPKIENFQLHELLDTIALEFKSIANTKQLRFEIIAPTLNIKSDRNLLMRIIQNLVSNAIRYTEKGSVLITTRIRGDFIRIEVRDSGIGISKDQQQAIFKEFYQVPSRKIENTNGLGIGLSIVQRLSKLLNHELEIISDIDRGSTFAVMVPLIKTDFKTNTSRLRISCNLDTFNGNRVLVIDDDVLILRSMHSLLTHWGCSVTSVTSGKEACDLIQPETPEPNIIIADYKLQDGETGIDAIKLIKRMLNISAPILIITGDTSEETINEIKSQGYSYLHKPIAASKLRSILRFIFDENNNKEQAEMNM